MTQSSHGPRGQMDISEQTKTWNVFLGFTKWAVILNVLLLAFLFVFRTH